MCLPQKITHTADFRQNHRKNHRTTSTVRAMVCFIQNQTEHRAPCGQSE